MRVISLVALAFACCCVTTSQYQQEPADPGMTMEPVDIREAASAAPVLIPRIGFDVGVDEASVNLTIAFMESVTAQGATALVIEFNTPGGSVDDGFRLAKAIEASPIPVHCIVDGEAASMGFYLLQSCTTRTMTDRSSLMAHEPAIGVGSFYGQKVKWQNIFERLRVMSSSLNHHMAKRLNISFEEFQKRVDNKDWWMTSEEALAVKAVDAVVPSVAVMLIELQTTGSWLGK